MNNTEQIKTVITHVYFGKRFEQSRIPVLSATDKTITVSPFEGVEATLRIADLLKNRCQYQRGIAYQLPWNEEAMLQEAITYWQEQATRYPNRPDLVNAALKKAAKYQEFAAQINGGA